MERAMQQTNEQKGVQEVMQNTVSAALENRLSPKNEEVKEKKKVETHDFSC